jgi:hypothetical protein
MTATDPNPYAASLEAPALARRRASHPLVWGCAAVGILGLLAFVAVAAFLAGVFTGESSVYHRRAVQQMESIRQFLDQHPDKFSDVTVYEASAGYAPMTGTVASQADYDLLESEMKRQFGEELGHELTWRVEVAPPTGDDE